MRGFARSVRAGLQLSVVFCPFATGRPRRPRASVPARSGPASCPPGRVRRRARPAAEPEIGAATGMAFNARALRVSRDGDCWRIRLGCPETADSPTQIRLHSTPHLARPRDKRPTAGIRRQYRSGNREPRQAAPGSSARRARRTGRALGLDVEGESHQGSDQGGPRQDDGPADRRAHDQAPFLHRGRHEPRPDRVDQIQHRLDLRIAGDDRDDGGGTAPTRRLCDLHAPRPHSPPAR